MNCARGGLSGVFGELGKHLLVLAHGLVEAAEILQGPAAFVKRFGQVDRVGTLLDQAIDQGQALLPVLLAWSA